MEDFQLNPFRIFLLPLYAEAKAHITDSMLSPPNIKNHIKYDSIVRVLINDEVV
jgi:hypothetical protein